MKRYLNSLLVLLVLLAIGVAVAQNGSTSRNSIPLPGSGPISGPGGSLLSVKEPATRIDERPRPIPDPPVPVAPIPGTKVKGGSGTALAVEPVPGAELYHFIVYRTAPGTLYCEGYSESPYWIMPQMPPYIPGAYYWTCQVNDGKVWSVYFAPAWWFEIEKPSNSTITDGAMEQPNRLRRQDLPWAQPNPCGPDGAGIWLNLAAAGRVTVAVYTVDGKLIKTISRTRSLNAGSHMLRWDGRDKSGRMVGAGTYLCRITAGGARSVVRIIKSR
jgi:hypothetical protein